MEKWSKVSVPIYLKVYIFDVVNGMQVESKGEEPIVVERGPFVFYETREKHVVSIDNDSNIIHYNDQKTFYFRQDLSNGSLDDHVNVVNVPLVVIYTTSSILHRALSYPTSFVLLRALSYTTSSILLRALSSDFLLCDSFISLCIFPLSLLMHAFSFF